MSARMVVGVALLAVLATGGGNRPSSAAAHEPGKDARLSRIGPAPDFALTTADGATLSLRALRGKVVVVTFLYAACTDTCPILAAKLVSLQEPLKADLGTNVVFAAITVDPERDTPEVLREYAKRHGAQPGAWWFLTGPATTIDAIMQRYGVYRRKMPAGDVDHTFLTSLIDRDGVLRVQYMGVRFEPQEMLRDLRSLLGEARAG